MAEDGEGGVLLTGEWTSAALTLDVDTPLDEVLTTLAEKGLGAGAVVAVRVDWAGESEWCTVPADTLARWCTEARQQGKARLRDLYRKLKSSRVTAFDLRAEPPDKLGHVSLFVKGNQAVAIRTTGTTRSAGDGLLGDGSPTVLFRPAGIPLDLGSVHPRWPHLLGPKARPGSFEACDPLAGEEPFSVPVDSLPAPPARVEQETLHWNTTFPNDQIVQRSRVLPAGFPCVLRTSLGPTAEPFSLTAGAADLSGLAQEKEAVDVQFRVEVEGAGARRLDRGSDFAASVWSDRLSCVPGVGTPTFDVEIQADTPGEIKISLLLFVRGAEIATAHIELRAVEPAPVAAAHGALSLAGLRRTRTASAWLMFRADGPECTVEARIGAMQSDSPLKVATRAADLEALINAQRKALVQMSARYEPEGDDLGLAGGTAFVEELASLGRELHAALFGLPGDSKDLLAIGEGIARLGHPAPGAAGHKRAPRLQIDAQLLAVPWGIVYDGPDGSPPDPAGFWGYRFQIDRILRLPLTGRSSSTVDIALSPRTSMRPVINEGLDAEQSVSVVEAQRSFFAQRGASPPIVQRAGLEALLKDEEASKLLYFFCHGVAAETSAFHKKMSLSEAKLAVDKAPISVAEMIKLRRGEIPGSPLVFLNACSTTQGDSEYPSVFVETFLKLWAARGVIGADWKLPTVFADRFARRVLSRLLSGAELGDAFHAVTVQAMQANNPFGLIYALYAPPEITVTLPPENKP